MPRLGTGPRVVLGLEDAVSATNVRNEIEDYTCQVCGHKATVRMTLSTPQFSFGSRHFGGFECMAYACAIHRESIKAEMMSKFRDLWTMGEESL